MADNKEKYGDVVLIYDSFDINFEKPVSIVRDIEQVEIREVLNGEFDLSLTTPYGEGSEYIKADNYIEILGDIFKIRKVVKSRNKNDVNLDIECEHVYFELLDDYIEKSDRRTFAPHELAEYLNEYSSIEIKVDDDVINNLEDFPKKRVTISRGSPIKTINRMIETWNLDLDRKRRVATLKSSDKINNIQLFKHQKNLVSLSREDNGGQLTTRLYPIGNEGLRIKGLDISEIEFKTEVEDNIATILSKDDVVLGRVIVEDGKISEDYIDSKYLDSFPKPRYGEIVESEIDTKIDLLLKGLEEINNMESVISSYEMDVQELVSIYGEIERFGLGYKAIIQDEVILKDHEHNLTEAKINEYTYYPFDGSSPSKVKINKKEDKALKFFEDLEEVKQKVDENIGTDYEGGESGGGGGGNSKPESVKKVLSYDRNNDSIIVDTNEVEVANLDVSIDEAMNSQGEILINFVSDKDSLVAIRIYDNDIQELYSPIMRHVNKGHNSIGIPHTIVNKDVGQHIMSVTMQSKDSILYIQPMGATFNVEIIGEGVDLLNIEAMDLTIKKVHNEDVATDVYVSGVDEKGSPIIFSSPYIQNRNYTRSDFKEVYRLNDVTDSRNVLVEFNGYFDLPSGENTFKLNTQEEPWIFWINGDDELWGQYGDVPSTSIMLSENTLQASAVRGWSMKNEPRGDMGLVVAYVKYDGYVHYRQLTGLMNEIEQDATWGPEEIVEEVGSGNSAVYVNRLNDYRMSFSIDGANKVLITERSYVGQASPKEYVKLDIEYDDWMSIFTAIPVRELPYNLQPIVTTDDNISFNMKANYEWILRGPRDEAFDIIVNESTEEIVDIFVSEVDPRVLTVIMSNEVDRGRLIVSPRKRNLIGKHTNGTFVEINEDLEVFNIQLKAEEMELAEFNIEFDNMFFKSTQSKDLSIHDNSSLNFNVSIKDIAVDIAKIDTLDSSETENVTLELRVNMSFDAIRSEDIEA